MTATDVREIKDLLGEIKTMLENEPPPATAHRRAPRVASTPRTTADRTRGTQLEEEAVKAFLQGVPSGTVVKASELFNMYHTSITTPEGSVPAALKSSAVKFAKYAREFATVARRGTGNYYTFR